MKRSDDQGNGITLEDASKAARLSVSVCMATYNGATFVRRQLDSILAQLAPDDEVVIVDDCSTDATLETIRGIGDPRIHLFENATNSGPSASFEAALRRSRNQLICLSDQDDIWLPGKIHRLQVLFADPNVQFAVHDCTPTDSDLNILFPSFFRWRHVSTGVLKNFIHPSYMGCCMAFRCTLLQVVLPFPRFRQILHDVWIGLVAELNHITPVLIPEPYLLYVRHGQTTTNILNRRAISRIAMERCVLLLALTKYLLKTARTGRLSVER